MLRFYWTPVVASRVHVFYPPTTQEAPWSRIVLAFVWTTAYLCIPGQLSIADSMDTVKISKRFACANELSKWHFWETGVGLWSTAHFVYNAGRSRGGAWEARAPLFFLDQTEAAPKGPKKFFGRPPSPCYLRVWMTARPPSPYLKVWICHCIII